MNYKFNDVQSGIATEAAKADELSEAKCRLAGVNWQDVQSRYAEYSKIAERIKK